MYRKLLECYSDLIPCQKGASHFCLLNKIILFCIFPFVFVSHRKWYQHKISCTNKLRFVHLMKKHNFEWTILVQGYREFVNPFSGATWLVCKVWRLKSSNLTFLGTFEEEENIGQSRIESDIDITLESILAKRHFDYNFFTSQ